jgi:hypothetical protein
MENIISANNFVGQAKGRIYLEDLDVEGKVIMIWTVKQM